MDEARTAPRGDARDAPETGHLGSALVYTDEVPVDWSRLETEPSAGRLSTMLSNNERLLRHIASLDDIHHETDDEELAGLGPGLARLEFKLNILMEMVSAVLAHQITLPPRTEIRLGSSDVVWRTTGTDPAPGERCLVRLFINSQYPHPLELIGTVVRIDAQRHEVTMHYDRLPDALQDQLEKLIFRQHRRLISQRHRQAE